MVRGLGSDVRINILNVLGDEPRNVNDIAEILELPQSTVATNILVLEEHGLICTENVKAKKGSQKLCRRPYRELVVRFDDADPASDGAVEVAMPIGLYTNYEVEPPCGLRTPDGVVGFLDVPDSFLSPERMKAGLLWFQRGWVEYKFPNNSLLRGRAVARLELGTEFWSDGGSVVELAINNTIVDRRSFPAPEGMVDPGSNPWDVDLVQGTLKTWGITADGTFLDGVRVSDVCLDDLDIGSHHSIMVRVGMGEQGDNRGGLRMFGRYFGRNEQDLLLRMVFQ